MWLNFVQSPKAAYRRRLNDHQMRDLSKTYSVFSDDEWHRLVIDLAESTSRHGFFERGSAVKLTPCLWVRVPTHPV